MSMLIMLAQEHAVLTGLVIIVALAWLSPILLGAVLIRERQVGTVVKKFGARSLPPGRLIALADEPGYQAGTLAPGLHFGYFRWQYRILKMPVTVVPQGEIALVVAADGAAIPAERILGKIVDCDNFQDARKFLVNGGEKGRQLGILTAGTYRINKALFSVITSESAPENGMGAQQLALHRVEPDMVGIVTTLDGQPIEAGEIAGPVIAGHQNFQNAQAFLDGAGRRGLQEQILLSGTWNLNPWFVQVEQVPMVQIPIGYVGVVISFVGQAHVDVSGLEFKHGDLVEVGHKGVWVTPLYPGASDESGTGADDQHRAQLGLAHRSASLRRETLVHYRALEGRLRVQPRRGADHSCGRARCAEGDLARRLNAKPGGPRTAADCRQLFPQLGAGLHRARLPERAQPAPGGSRRAHPDGAGRLRRAGD